MTPLLGRLTGSVIIIFVLSACESKDTTVALGTVERNSIHLTATANEIITQQWVEEGQRVTAGTPLLQLDDRTAQLELGRAQANVDRAYANWQQALNGARPEEQLTAQARVGSAKAKLTEAEHTYQRRLSLVAQKLMGQADLDNAIAQRDAAIAAHQEAEQQLALLQHGTRQEQIDQAQAQWQEATQTLAIAQKQLADLTLIATRDGRIDSLPWHPGERVAIGTLLVVMLVDEQPYIRTYMPESIRASLTIGQPLHVTVDGIDTPFTGTLTHIQQDPAFTPHYALTETERSRLMYLAKVQLGEDAINLPSGLPAQVTVPTQRVKATQPPAASEQAP